MRPPVRPVHTLDLPRLRRRRAHDVAQISLAYASALGLMAATATATCFSPGGLARHPEGFTAGVLTIFCCVIYLAIGGVVVALAVRRLAFWSGQATIGLARAPWTRVVLWPVAIAALLVKAAFPSAG
jgi:hypothetical protein